MGTLAVSTMKLIVIGCLLASAYSANLEALAGPQGQYFERTPNNNLVQIKYVGAGSGLNNAAFNSQNQRTGNFNQELNNQQNQFTQVFTQGTQNLNQQSQVAQFAQQNQGFSVVNAKPFSFNGNQFANPNLVEVSFDENRHQQFIANQERQRQQFQTQPKQGQAFQNQQRQSQQQQQQQQQLQQQQQQQQRQRQQQKQQQQQRQRQQQQQQQQLQRQREQQSQQNQFKTQEQQRLTQISQAQVQNKNPFFNRGFQQQTSINRIIPVPERVQSSLVVPQTQFQGHNRINHIHHQGSFQNQFPQPISTPMREIAGHLQRVDSDEILGIFQPFTIPVSASLYEGNVNSQFSCAAQGQGFYADPSNNCQQFHVCTRVQGRNTPDLYRFTFQCAEGEYFDQGALTCLRLAGLRSGSCAASPSVYQSSKNRALQLFSAFSATPTPPAQPHPVSATLPTKHILS